MIGLRLAFKTAIEANKHSSALIGSQTASVLQLGAGEAAEWTLHERLSLFEPSVPGNDRWAARVTAIDLGLDKITIDPELPTTPLAGSVARGGLMNWTGDVSDRVAHRSPRFSSPVDDLLNDQALSECVVFFGELVGESIAGRLVRLPVEVRGISRDPTWASAAAWAARLLFDMQPGNLTRAGLHVERVEATGTPHERPRSDEFHEYMTALEVFACEVPA